MGIVNLSPDQIKAISNIVENIVGKFEVSQDNFNDEKMWEKINKFVDEEFSNLIPSELVDDANDIFSIEIENVVFFQGMV